MVLLLMPHAKALNEFYSRADLVKWQYTHSQSEQ